MPPGKTRGCWTPDETVDRVGFASRYPAVDDGCESFTLIASRLYRRTAGVLHNRGMLCVRVRISCRHDLSQTRRETRVRRGSIVFNQQSRAHLPGTTPYSRLRLCSRQLFLSGISW